MNIENSPIKDWNKALTMSSDGQKIVAAAFNEYIYISDDGGETWSQKTGAGTGAWWDVEISNDGQHIVVASFNFGKLMVSNNAGDSWTEITSVGSRDWRGVAMSSDGQKVAAGRYGNILTSLDGGSTWINEDGTNLQNQLIDDIAISDDGTYIIAGRAGSGGRISLGVLIDTTPPVVTITSPLNNTTYNTGTWNPYVGWDDSYVCMYAFNTDDFSVVDCANEGSDIPAPDGSGTHTLTVRGTDTSDNLATSSVTFTFVADITPPSLFIHRPTNLSTIPVFDAEFADVQICI